MKAQPTQGGETLRCSGAGSDVRDEIADLSDKLKAPDSDVHRRTGHGHHRRVR
jgi:hypothetical protein